MNISLSDKIVNNSYLYIFYFKNAMYCNLFK